MAERKTSKRKARRCECCGAELPKTNIDLCDACREAGFGCRNDQNDVTARELLEVAMERQRCGMNPIQGLDMGQISLLARCFRAPYSTYGRLRGYVTATGKLPPGEFLRRNDIRD